MRAPDGPALRYLNKKMIDSFNFMHFGYRWNEILALVYSDLMKDGFLAGGYRMRAEAGEFYRDTPECLPSPPLRPFLLGLLREEVERDGEFGSRLAPVFVYQRPRFQFRRGEQELLLRVLLGETDEEVAAALCISMHTVKTRWRNIYTRVESSLPDFFPNTTTPGRGPARRSLLLRYLEDHLEELRPFLVPSRRN